jgi:hypothetical protein
MQLTLKWKKQLYITQTNTKLLVVIISVEAEEDKTDQNETQI